MSDLDRILTLARHGTDNDAQSQVPAERELKEVPVTKEAVGEFAQPLYDLQDDLGLEDNILVDEMARWMDGQEIKEFVENFRRHHDMNHPGEGVEYGEDDKNFEATEEAPVEELPEAKAKPDFADIDGDGDEKETMKKAAKDKEVKETTVEENLEKAQEEIDELKEEELKEDCSCGHGADCDCGPDCKCGCNAVTEETVTEAPTMDTTQLITLLKNAGLTEEAINKKLNEWANTPEGAAEEEETSHGEPYENFAQSVNLSLKRYLDAEDFKVGLTEHKVEDIKEAYQEFKGVPVEEKKKD
jgi:hypothetical protein